MSIIITPYFDVSDNAKIYRPMYNKHSKFQLQRAKKVSKLSHCELNFLTKSVIIWIVIT